MTHLLGIDYGTSQFKVQIFDMHGRLAAGGGGSIPVDRSRPGLVEQDTRRGWRAVSNTIRELLGQAAIDPNSILAIGTTGTTNINLLDKAGHPLRPAILYGDERIPSEKELQRIRLEFGKQIGESFGFTEVDDPTWTMLLRLFPSAKLLWLYENEPRAIDLAKTCVSSSWDYINARLTGSVSHWESSLEADHKILAQLDLPDNFFGESRKTGEVVGTVDDRGASETGLAPGTPVIMGATDSLCSFLGAGIHRPGIALNAAGTTDVVAVSTKGRPESSVGYPVQYLFDDLWLLSLSPIRGPALSWLKDTLLSPRAGYADLDALAAESPPGAEGLLCLPYFSGEKGLIHDPMARGALIGLDLHHGRSHIARAGLEGIAMSLRQILEAYRDEGVLYSEVRLCGGGARSEIWNQIKADVLCTEVHVLRVHETGCLGAAMIASVPAGVCQDLSSASQTFAKVSHVIEPNASLREVYEGAYQAFRKVYPAISAAFKPLHEVAGVRKNGAT